MKPASLFIGLCVAVLGAGAAWSEMAVVRMKATAESGAIAGTVTLTETGKGLKLVALLTGVPAGDHGFHIHEFGSCEDSGKAAGSHYNPKSSKHGDLLKEGHGKAHAGDMGSVSADKDGKAALDVLLPEVGLSSGTFNVGGRSLILHDKPDDFSQPAGNAGARIACGVIAITAR